MKARSNRNNSGLKKHPLPSPVPSELFSHPTPPRPQAPSPEGDDGDGGDLEVDDRDLELLIHFDSVKTNFEHEEEFPDDEDMGGNEAERTWSCVGEGDEGEIEGCESHQAASLPVNGTYNTLKCRGKFQKNHF